MSGAGGGGGAPGGDPAPGAGLRPLRRSRAETLAGLLPLVGLFALMPPFIRVFAADARLFGVPLILLFVLAVWLGLVVAAWRLSRRLGGGRAPPPPG